MKLGTLKKGVAYDPLRTDSFVLLFLSIVLREAPLPA